MEFASLIGQRVTVTVDRPLGSAHPKYPKLIYPVNYGYVAGRRLNELFVRNLIEL